MNMIATVATKEKAWQLADKLFPTDYSRNEPDSLRAGYPIFNTTSTDSKYKGFHISDLNAALELNMGAETIRLVAGTGRRNRMKHIRRNGTTSSFRCTH